MFGEEAVDGGLEFDDGMEHAALEASLRQLGEEALDGVEPRTGSRREVEGESLVTVEPSAHLGMLVDGIVVEDDVNGLVRRRLGVDGVEEADELLMAMALHIAPDDRAVEHVEGGEQRGRAAALVVMGHGAEASLLDGQAGLGAVERLDLALLVDRQHDGVGRRVDIEPDDVPELVDELRIVGELEPTPAVGPEPVRLPEAPDRAGAYASGLRHHVGRPVRRFARRIRKRQHHHAFAHFRTERRNAGRPRLVAQESLEALFGEAVLPAPDAGLGLARVSHDLDGADAIGAEQHDLRAPNMLVRTVPVIDQRRKALTIGRRNREGYSCTHAPDSHAPLDEGIQRRTLPSGGHH